MIKKVKKLLDKRLAEHRGLTLIEIVVSIALFAILGVILCSTLMSAITITNHSKRITNTGMSLAQNIDSNRAAGNSSGSSATIGITFTGATASAASGASSTANHDVPGHVVSAVDSKTGLSYYEFVPDSTATGASSGTSSAAP